MYQKTEQEVTFSHDIILKGKISKGGHLEGNFYINQFKKTKILNQSKSYILIIWDN